MRSSYCLLYTSWRDADDAQLISYVDSFYGSFSARNYELAITKVTDDRSYHPILEFLNALPEWDRTVRADTLLIDYLGAADTAYVRAVTRKTCLLYTSRYRYHRDGAAHGKGKFQDDPWSARGQAQGEAHPGARVLSLIHI